MAMASHIGDRIYESVRKLVDQLSRVLTLHRSLWKERNGNVFSSQKFRYKGAFMRGKADIL